MTLKRRRIGAARYNLKEMVLMIADYNGWADEREEEREALDQFEITLAAATSTRRGMPGVRGILLRAAAREILAVGGTRHQPHPPPV